MSEKVYDFLKEFNDVFTIRIYEEKPIPVKKNFSSVKRFEMYSLIKKILFMDKNDRNDFFTLCSSMEINVKYLNKDKVSEYEQKNCEEIIRLLLDECNIQAKNNSNKQVKIIRIAYKIISEYFMMFSSQKYDDLFRMVIKNINDLGQNVQEDFHKLKELYVKQLWSFPPDDKYFENIVIDEYADNPLIFIFKLSNKLN